MSTFDEIAERYGADKAQFARGMPGHGYSAVYTALFEHRREESLSLLELGYAEGRSAALWCEYFPNATVSAIELTYLPLPMDAPPGFDDVNRYLGDVTDPALLDQVGREQGPFDIIVDDASHYPDQTAVSFAGLWPHLRSGGLYCVEDVQLPPWGDKESGVGTSGLVYWFEQVARHPTTLITGASLWVAVKNG